MTQDQEEHTSQPYISKDRIQRLVPLIKIELERAEEYVETLHAWGAAIEIKDAGTRGHTARVTDLAIDLARWMKLCWPDICNLKLGSYLHDVGKIMVPDEILLKPGKLTAEEMDEMKKHPGHAYQMLKSMKFLRKAIDVPYCHHERWDGSGYPRGLAGEEIPLAARIFMVVDNWDAMTSDRSYRRALSQEFTLRFIRHNSGKMFDPAVVTAFIEMIQQRSSE